MTDLLDTNSKIGALRKSEAEVSLTHSWCGAVP